MALTPGGGASRIAARRSADRSSRPRRDGARVAATRDALRQRAATGENLLPPILDCVRAETTLGEIADTLRTVFGEHTDPGRG